MVDPETLLGCCRKIGAVVIGSMGYFTYILINGVYSLGWNNPRILTIYCTNFLQHPSTGNISQVGFFIGGFYTWFVCWLVVSHLLLWFMLVVTNIPWRIRGTCIFAYMKTIQKSTKMYVGKYTLHTLEVLGHHVFSCGWFPSFTILFIYVRVYHDPIFRRFHHVFTRWGPLTTISGFIPSYTHSQPWLNRVCWGYNYLITRGGPSCMWRHADFQRDPWILWLLEKDPHQNSATFTKLSIIERDVFFYHMSYQKKTTCSYSMHI